MNPPHFATIGTAAPEAATTEPRPFVPSGFPKIDRILQTPPHPVEARYHRGEATLAELLEVTDAEGDSGVTIEETLAWLRGEAPRCAPAK